MNNEPKELITDEFKKDLRDYLDAFSAWKAALVVDPVTIESTVCGITIREVYGALMENIDESVEGILKHNKRVLARFPALTIRDLEYCLLCVNEGNLAELASLAEKKND